MRIFTCLISLSLSPLNRVELKTIKREIISLFVVRSLLNWSKELLTNISYSIVDLKGTYIYTRKDCY